MILTKEHEYKITGDIIASLARLSEAVQKEDLSIIYLVAGQLSEQLKNCRITEIKDEQQGLLGRACKTRQN